MLEYDDAKIAEAVVRAISPDNFKTPKGLYIRTIQRANKVLTQIRSRGKFSTFIVTIDDLLFCISTAEKTLQTISKLK